jgi:hypothetical protein
VELRVDWVERHCGGFDNYHIIFTLDDGKIVDDAEFTVLVGNNRALSFWENGCGGRHFEREL